MCSGLDKTPAQCIQCCSYNQYWAVLWVLIPGIRMPLLLLSRLNFNLSLVNDSIDYASLFANRKVRNKFVALDDSVYRTIYVRFTYTNFSVFYFILHILNVFQAEQECSNALEMLAKE